MSDLGLAVRAPRLSKTGEPKVVVLPASAGSSTSGLTDVSVGGVAVTARGPACPEVQGEGGDSGGGGAGDGAAGSRGSAGTSMGSGSGSVVSACLVSVASTSLWSSMHAPAAGRSSEGARADVPRTSSGDGVGWGHALCRGRGTPGYIAPEQYSG